MSGDDEGGHGAGMIDIGPCLLGREPGRMANANFAEGIVKGKSAFGIRTHRIVIRRFIRQKRRLDGGIPPLQRT